MTGLLATSAGQALAAPWPMTDSARHAEAGYEPRRWMKQPIVPNQVEEKIRPLDYAEEVLAPDSLLGRRLEIARTVGLLQAIELDSYLRPYREKTRPRWPSGEYLGKYMQGFSRM